MSENGKNGWPEEVHEGMLKLIVSEVSQWSDDSEEETANQCIAELPWHIEVERSCLNNKDEENENSERSGDEDGTEYLSVYVCCNSSSESNLWSCDASINIKLLSTRVGIHGTISYNDSFKATYKFNQTQFGIEKFIAWDVLTSTDLGYVKNDEFTIEAHISIKNIVGVYNSIPIDFLTEHRNYTDVILTVEGHQLHLNKSYLGMYSRFFNAMFFSSFNESIKDEIVLRDVKFNEFIDMLKVIYPTRKPIDAHNVDYLLKLGDQYDVRFVMRECESFLISASDITVAKKFLYADQYRMSALQEVCLEELTDAQSVKKLTTTDEYSKMSDATRSVLLKKVLKFV